MDVLLFVGAIAVLVALIGFMVFCLKRDRDLVGFYKQINVCGRFYAFITADCLQVGAICLIGTPVVFILTLLGVFDQNSKTSGWTVCLTYAVAAAIMLSLGIFLYRRAAKKCDPGLQRTLLKDMFIIMWATVIRIDLIIFIIFAHTWLVANAPLYYLLPDGREVFVYPRSNRVYDYNGSLVAIIDNDGNLNMHYLFV